MVKDLLPLCSFFLAGECLNDRCNYRHEQVRSPSTHQLFQLMCRSTRLHPCAETSMQVTARMAFHVNSSMSTRVGIWEMAMKLVVPKTKPAATQESESVSNVNSFLPSFVKIG